MFHVWCVAGTLSSVGVHTSEHFPFAPGALYDKNITYKSGRCPARHIMSTVALPMLQHGGCFTSSLSELVISHRLPLSAGPSAYHMFNNKEDACTKVVFVCESEPAALSAPVSKL